MWRWRRRSRWSFTFTYPLRGRQVEVEVEVEVELHLHLSTQKTAGGGGGRASSIPSEDGRGRWRWRWRMRRSLDLARSWRQRWNVFTCSLVLNPAIRMQNMYMRAVEIWRPAQTGRKKVTTTSCWVALGLKLRAISAFMRK